ncbi:nuclear apoptosis-inducing factor 1-like [Lineus longissimus]|uniref:nuclear apoptosis-inducing factor 1-like n=1 Tax=Lineus longissimus TaxID=88925 RepID=UPI00315C769E
MEKTNKKRNTIVPPPEEGKKTVVPPPEEGKRKRGVNFSPNEIIKLVDLVESKWSVISSKFSDVITLKRKSDTWKEITLKINSVASVRRTTEAVHHKWHDLKSKAKQKAAKINVLTKRTGNKPLGDDVSELTQLEQRIVGLIGVEMIQGIATGMDTEELDLPEDDMNQQYPFSPSVTEADDDEISYFDQNASLSLQKSKRIRKVTATVTRPNDSSSEDDTRSPSPPPSPVRQPKSCRPTAGSSKASSTGLSVAAKKSLHTFHTVELRKSPERIRKVTATVTRPNDSSSEDDTRSPSPPPSPARQPKSCRPTAGSSKASSTGLSLADKKLSHAVELIDVEKERVKIESKRLDVEEQRLHLEETKVHLAKKAVWLLEVLVDAVTETSESQKTGSKPKEYKSRSSAFSVLEKMAKGE